MAQVPTNLGTTIFSNSGAYTTYSLTQVGGFKQYRSTATNNGAASTRQWEFYSTTTANYYYNWRPYNAGLTLANFNQVIDPTTDAASARYNSNYGGATGLLPAVTSGRTYTFNIANSTGNAGTSGNSGYGNLMAVLETAYTPRTITAVSNPGGQAQGQISTITATPSGTLSTGEYLWLRYSVDNFATSSTVLMTGSGTTYTADIPAQALGATVKYYVLSAPVNTGVTHTTADMLTLNLLNNSNNNYSFQVQLCGTYTVNPGGAGTRNYPTLGTAFDALNNYGVFSGCGGVTFNVKDGVTFNEQNLLLNTFANTGNAPVVFQRDNSGSTRPKVTPATNFGAGGAQDAIIKLSGADNVTFDGIDVVENAANTGADRMEYGYALFRVSGTNACQNISIQNATVTLNRANTNATTGVYGALTDLSGTAISPANSATGNYRNVKVNGLTISNAYHGIAFFGGSGNSAADALLEFGTTAGNTLTDLGDGSLGDVYGIHAECYSGLKVENNSITLATTTATSSVYGIGLGVQNAGAQGNANGLGYGAVLVNANTLQVSSNSTAIVIVIWQRQANVVTSSITNNVVRNCALTGTTANVQLVREDASSSVTTGVVMSGNTIGGSAATANTVATTSNAYVLYAPGGTNTGLTATDAFTNNEVSYNTFSGTAGSLFFLVREGGNNANFAISYVNNRILNNTTAKSGTIVGIYHNSNGGKTLTINNNTFQHNTFTGTSPNVYGIATGTLTVGATATVSNNLVDDVQLTGTGAAFWGVRPLQAGTLVVNNNTVSNVALTNVGTSGSLYGILSNSNSNFASTLTFSGNVLTDLSLAGTGAGTGSVLRALYVENANVPATTLLSNNVVRRLTLGATGTPTFGGEIRGITAAAGAPLTVTANRVGALTAYGTGSYVYGVLNTFIYASSQIDHNLIGELYNPQANGSGTRVVGVYYATNATSAGWVGKLYHNTIYLNATGGATFSSYGVYSNANFLNTATATFDLRNNVIVNTSTPGSAAGYTVVVGGQSGVAGVGPLNIAAASDNNVYYAGTPGARRVIYLDANNVNIVPTLDGYAHLLADGREQHSRTGAVTFASTDVTNAAYLHLSTGAAQPAESAGQVIATLPTDVDGDPHFGASGYAGTGTAPDAGADEGTFTPIDKTAPVVLYTPVPTQLIGSTPTLSADITDAGSTVNATTGTRPRLYYKLSTSTDTYVDNTSATNGWKWVEASNAATPFSFTFDYAKLPATVAVGTTIQYFVVAQDNAATPNVGTGPGLLFSTTPASVALTAANFPVAFGTVRAFIVRGPLSGTVLVGPGQTYTSLTNAGGLFQAINTGVLTGNLTALITGDLTAETGANALNPPAESPTGSNYTISIQPSAAALRTITFTANYMSLSGVDRLTIDGRFNQTGTDQWLRFRGNISNPLVWLRQDATYVTIRNCVLEGGLFHGSYGTVFLGNSYQSLDAGAYGGVTGNSHFSLLNCEVRDRSDISAAITYGVYSTAPNTVTNDDVTISGNVFSSCAAGAIYADLAGSNWTIGGLTTADGNVVYSALTSTLSQTLLRIDATPSATNILIQNNRLGGSASDNSGSWTNNGNSVVGIAVSSTDNPATSPVFLVRDNVVQNIQLNSTGNHRFLGVQATANVPVEISGNTIRNVSCAGTYSNFNGIYPVTLGTVNGIYASQAPAGPQIISGNLITGLSSTNSSANQTAVFGIIATNGNGTISRNRIYDLTNTNTGAVGGLTGIYVNSGSGWAVTNNQVTLTNGANGNPVMMIGLEDWNNSAGYWAFNSVLLGGTATSGNTPSYGYLRPNNANAATLRNNVLVNTRTGGSNRHAAIAMSNPGALTSNYNNLYTTVAANLGVISGTAYTFTTWKTTSGTPDVNSKNVPVKFVDETVGNLNLDPTTNCVLDGAGTVMAGVNGEFDNAATSRQTAPDLGSDAFTAVAQTASFVAASPLCGNGTATISFAGNGGPFSVTYTDGTTPVTLTNQSGTTASFPVTAGKTYTITSATDAYGCTLAAGTPLVVNPIPTFSAAAANALCNGGTGTITFSSLTGGGPYQFQYRTGANPFTTGTATGSGPYVLTLPTGTYDVRILSAAGCTSSIQTGLTIGEPTLLTASGGANPATVCPGTTTTVTATAAGGTGTKQYALDGGAFQTSNVFAGVSAGSHTVTVRDANNCVSAPASVTIGTTTTTTWTGATNTDWYTATNWTACVPAAGVNAVVPTGATVVIGTGTAVANDLTLQGSATLTISGTGNLNVYGALVLPAPAALVAQAGTVGFVATGAQTIPAATYYSLAVAGTTPKTLEGAVTVKHTLDLTSGLIAQGAYDLTMQDPAAGPLATIVGADASHFLIQDGAGALVFTRTGNHATAHASVTFPIGTLVSNALHYAPVTLALSANSSYVGAARANVTNAVPGNPSGVGNLVHRLWDVSWGSGALPAGETATVTLQWTTADEGATFDRTNCTVAHYDGTIWTNGPVGAATAAGASAWARSRSGLTTFSPFAVQDDNLPLPVELTSFTAMRTGADVLLAWTTASEKNSQGFRVEVSTDGRTFRQLTFVLSATPASLTPRQYAYLDTESGKAGTRYYRLRPLDLDGTMTASQLVAVTFGRSSPTGVSVFPNPAPVGATGTVGLNNWPAGPATLTLTDALGREVWRTTCAMTAATPLPTTLPAGTYVVTVTGAGAAAHTVFVKE